MVKGRIRKFAIILLLIAWTLGNVSAVHAGPLQDEVGTNDIVIDNSDPGVNIYGTWGTTSTSANPERSIGSNYLTVAKSAQAGQFIQYAAPASLQAGKYEVYLSAYRSGSNRSTNVPVEIGHFDPDTNTSAATSVVVSQKGTPSAAVWIPLGQYEFAAGSTGYVKIMVDGAESYVLADAVRLVPQFTPAPPAKSGDATLSSLAVSVGELAFDPAVKEYTLTVNGGVYKSIDITPTVNSAVYKGLTVNGQATVSGSTYSATLAAGSNLFAIRVTAEDDTVNTYTLTINRTMPSSEARLESLTLNRASLAFEPDTLSYLVQVGDHVTGLEVTPTVMSAVYKSLTVNGSPHLSGAPYPIQLAAGGNTAVIAVAAEDGTVKTYTVEIVRQGEAAVLSSLELSMGTLNFSPWRTAYSIYTGNKVEKLVLTPASASGFYERMTINGAAHVSGQPYEAVLAEGENQVVIRVYAKSGREMVYTIAIHRLDSEANARMVNGKTVLPAEKLAEALGVRLLLDPASGLLVYSDAAFGFNGSGDDALRDELLRLLNYRLTLDGQYASFFNPAQQDYLLLLPADGHIPAIKLEHRGGVEYAVPPGQEERTRTLTVNGQEVYTFTFVEDGASQLPAPSLAGIRMAIEGQEEEPVPTWLPVAYADSNDGYANVNTPGKTIDNDLNTRWSANSAGETDWLRYDLGGKRNVHSMALAGYSGNERIYHFEVEISGDGQTWQPLLPMQHTSGATLFPEIFDFPEAVETRYIRLLCYGYGPNYDGWNGVAEVRFYESEEQEQLDASKWAEYFAPPDNRAGDQLNLQLKGLSPEGTEFALDPAAVTVQFVSDHPDIAEVNSDGVVTLKKAGTVRINAIAEQGDAIRLSSIIIAVSE